VRFAPARKPQGKNGHGISARAQSMVRPFTSRDAFFTEIYQLHRSGQSAPPSLHSLAVLQHTLHSQLPPPVCVINALADRRTDGRRIMVFALT